MYVDVLKEYASKKCVKLGKLLKERGVEVVKAGGDADAPNTKSFYANAAPPVNKVNHLFKIFFCLLLIITLLALVSYH